jgi:hypothetical protein
MTIAEIYKSEKFNHLQTMKREFFYGTGCILKHPGAVEMAMRSEWRKKRKWDASLINENK